MVRSTGSLSSIGYLFALVLPQIDAADHSVRRAGGHADHAEPHVHRRRDHRHARRRRSRDGAWCRPSSPSAFWRLWRAAAASLWLTPWSIREFYRVENQLIAHELTADIQPRVFEEQFPNTILYVSDINPGPASRLKRIFMADITPPGATQAGRGRSRRYARASRSLRKRIAVPDVAQNRVTLRAAQRHHLRNRQGQSTITSPARRPASRAWKRRQQRGSNLPSLDRNGHAAAVSRGVSRQRPRRRARAVAGRPHRIALAPGRCRWPAFCWRWPASRWESPRGGPENRRPWF